MATIATLRLKAHIDTTDAEDLARRVDATIRETLDASPAGQPVNPSALASAVMGEILRVSQVPAPRGSEGLREQLLTLVESEMYEYRERTGFWPEGGVTTEIARLACRGALEAITAYFEFGPEDAWCKVCRRVWDGKHHQCEGDAEQRLARVRELHHSTCLLATGKVKRPAFSCEVCDTLDGAAPGTTAATGCPRCPHPAHSEPCGITADFNQCACPGNVIPA
jgi:hypothetical protein